MNSLLRPTLPTMADLDIGRTPLVRVKRYCQTGNLYVKLEQYNPTGSVKDRTCYGLFKEIVSRGRLSAGSWVVESTSGNLGLAMAFFGPRLGLQICCVIDHGIAPEKHRRLQEMGARIIFAEKGNFPDARTARIELARSLGRQSNWFWTNQFGNDAGVLAHAESTGPEIIEETEGRVAWVVASVGTGGTLCGIGEAVRSSKLTTEVVGVEPEGSTIFGGCYAEHLSVGAGLRGPSEIVRRFGHSITQSFKVSDGRAIAEALRFRSLEDLSVGVTTGMSLAVASRIAAQYEEDVVVAISPDSGGNYAELFRDFEQ